MPDATDVFVIGGGPAGLAAAIAARQQGFRVTVADGAKPPIDKACGEALMPDACEAFARLGFSLPFSDSSLVGGVRFLSSNLSADAEFPRGSFGISFRRPLLHKMMSDRAAELGVELLWQTPVTGISGDQIQLGDRTVRSRWIIGADGVNSRVRRWAGLQAHSRTRLRYAFRRHYRVRPWTDRLEIYWEKNSQAFASAINTEEMCVAVASHDPEFRLEGSLPEFQELYSRLRGAEITSTERGAVSANRKLRRVWRGNVALIGDASGTVDAITGEGLGLAFSQAVILAQSLKSGDLAGYQAAHRRLSRRPLWMARFMLLLDGRPRLQRRTLETFHTHPEIFRRLVALHIGKLSPLNLAVDGLTLGWGLLTA